MFISVNEFSNRYNVYDNHIYMMQHKLPKSVFRVDPYTKRLSIDEKFFLRRITFKKRVINYVHDMYFLVTKVWSESQMSKAIGVSQTTLNNLIWSLGEYSIFKYKIADAIWKMFRWFWKMELRIKKRYGVVFNIAEILDNESRITK